MTIKLSEARQLCTKAELELVVAAHPKNLVGMTPARLQGKIERARRLRDKYTTLAEAQKRKQEAARGSRGLADAGVRTLRKGTLFAELVEKFSAKKTKVEERLHREKEAAAKKAEKARLAAARAAAPKAAAPKAAKKTVKKASKAKGRPTAISPEGQSGAKNKATKITERTRTRAINAHIRSSGKRSQARRDSKGR